MSKATFRTQWEEHKHYYAPTGEHIEMRHTAHMKEDGRRVLLRDKKVNTFELIQSHKEECEIENIIRRAVEGDYNALNAVNGVFADITNCPSSIAEAQQYIIDAKNEFDKLPKDIKAKFEYNPEIYISEMSTNTESWLEKTGFAEKVRLKKEQADAKAKTDENFAKAMEMIASGTALNNVGGELTNE